MPSHIITRLHREVEAFVEYISPHPEEDEVRALTVEMIQRAVVKNFPDAQVLPFGSYETKLYLPLGCASFLLQCLFHDLTIPQRYRLGCNVQIYGVF